MQYFHRTKQTGPNQDAQNWNSSTTQTGTVLGGELSRLEFLHHPNWYGAWWWVVQTGSPPPHKLKMSIQQFFTLVLVTIPCTNSTLHSTSHMRPGHNHAADYGQSSWMAFRFPLATFFICLTFAMAIWRSFIVSWRSPPSVSYTHLTLPTSGRV